MLSCHRGSRGWSVWQCWDVAVQRTPPGTQNDRDPTRRSKAADRTTGSGREDPYDVAAAADPLVEPFLGVVGPDPAPVRLRETAEASISVPDPMVLPASTVPLGWVPEWGVEVAVVGRVVDGQARLAIVGGAAAVGGICRWWAPLVANLAHKG